MFFGVNVPSLFPAKTLVPIETVSGLSVEGRVVTVGTPYMHAVSGIVPLSVTATKQFFTSFSKLNIPIGLTIFIKSGVGIPYFCKCRAGL